MLLLATSCSQLNSTTVVGEPTAATAAASSDPALVAAISNDVIFQSDPLTTDLAEATCIGEQTVSEIGSERLAQAGVTVSFPNPLAAELTDAEMVEVVQVIETCTGVRTSSAGAENATGAVENVAASTAAVEQTTPAERAESEGDPQTAQGDVEETESAAADDADVAPAADAGGSEDPVTEDPVTEDPVAAESVAEESVVDAQPEGEDATPPTIEAAAAEPAPSLTEADRGKLAGYFGQLGAETTGQAECMVSSVVAELSLTTETASALVATSPLPMPERRAVNRAMVSCMDMRPLIAAVLETSGMPADQVSCLAANLDIQGQVDVFSNINPIVANPYEALRTYLGSNPALTTCGI